jgi:hypothetical protein
LTIFFTLKQILNFFSNTNSLTAAGAVLASFATAQAFAIPMPALFYIYLFLASWCSYCLHWYFSTDASISNKDAWSIANKNILLVITLISGIVGIYVLSLLPRTYILYSIPLVLLSLLYTAPKIPYSPFIYLRKFVVAKTLYLTLAWYYATVLLPLYLSNTAFNSTTFHYGWHRFIIIFIVCLLFDLKDKKMDVANGIKSMIYQMSTPIVSKVILFLCSMAFISAARLLAVLNVYSNIGNILTVLLIIVLYKKTLASKDEIWYYYVVDGLMYLSGLIGLVSLVMMG